MVASSLCASGFSSLRLSILQPEWAFEVKPHSSTPTLNLSLAFTDYGMKLKLKHEHICLIYSVIATQIYTNTSQSET